MPRVPDRVVPPWPGKGWISLSDLQRWVEETREKVSAQYQGKPIEGNPLEGVRRAAGLSSDGDQR